MRWKGKDAQEKEHIKESESWHLAAEGTPRLYTRKEWKKADDCNAQLCPLPEEEGGREGGGSTRTHASRHHHNHDHSPCAGRERAVCRNGVGAQAQRGREDGKMNT